MFVDQNRSAVFPVVLIAHAAVGRAAGADLRFVSGGIGKFSGGLELIAVRVVEVDREARAAAVSFRAVVSDAHALELLLDLVEVGGIDLEGEVKMARVGLRRIARL